MKRTLILLTLLLCAGCGATKSTQTPPPPPPPPPSATLVGGWAGNITGTNFSGTLTGGQLNIGQSGGTLAGNVGGWGIPGCGTIDDSVTATQTGANFTVSSPTVGMSGVISGTGDGTLIAGTIYFIVPCHTDEKWTGNFSMTRRY